MGERESLKVCEVTLERVCGQTIMLCMMPTRYVASLL